MRYPESSCLPLNALALKHRFQPHTPGVPDSGEAGLWILFREGSLVLDGASGQATPLMETFPDGVPNPSEVILMGTWDGC